MRRVERWLIEREEAHVQMRDAFPGIRATCDATECPCLPTSGRR